MLNTFDISRPKYWSIWNRLEATSKICLQIKTNHLTMGFPSLNTEFCGGFIQIIGVITQIYFETTWIRICWCIWRGDYQETGSYICKIKVRYSKIFSVSKYLIFFHHQISDTESRGVFGWEALERLSNIPSTPLSLPFLLPLPFPEYPLYRFRK